MQQLSWIAPILLVIWVMLIGIRIGAYLDRKNKKDIPKIPIMPEKFCPPHRWKWIEQPGMENTYFMRCLRCKKTPRQISDGI